MLEIDLTNKWDYLILRKFHFGRSKSALVAPLNSTPEMTKQGCTVFRAMEESFCLKHSSVLIESDEIKIQEKACHENKRAWWAVWYRQHFMEVPG